MPPTLLAQGISAGETGISETAGAAGFGAAANLATLIGTLINVALGFVGFVFFAYTLYGGFLWMTSRGNEETVQKAIGIIRSGIIGVIIITSAYAISTAVVNAITTGSITGTTYLDELVPTVHAATANYGSFLGGVGSQAGVASSTGAPTRNLIQIVGDVIEVALGLLGVIFLILAVYAGFLWMTASGNEEKVQKAIGVLRTAIIGLVITLAAYAISVFVVDQLTSATGTGSTTTTTGG